MMKPGDNRSQKTRASLELLYSISRELASQLDLSELLARILKLTLETIGGDTGSIVVLDEHGKAAEGTYIHQAKLHEHTGDQLAETLQGGLAGWVLENRRGVLIPNVLEDNRWLKRDFELHEKLNRSAICVPIIVRDRVVGILTLVHHEKDHFQDEDLSLLTAIADQGGIAIENARLFTAEQRRRKFASTLQEIAQIVNASLDPSQVFPLILNQLRRVIYYDSASIFLHEGDQLRLVAAQGFEKDIVHLGFSISDGEEQLIGRVLNHKETLLITDVQKESGWVISDEIPETSKIRGWIGAPLIVQDKAVGVLTVDRQEAEAYGPSEVEIVSAFAHQTATAVANAQLYSQSQRQMKAMVALAETARVVSASLDLNEVLQRILSQTMSTLDVEAASLALIDEETGELEFKVASGSGAESMIGIRLGRGEGIAGWVVDKGEPIIVQDVQTDTRFYPEVDQQIGFKTNALACVPIYIKDEIKGVLEAINPGMGAFEPPQLEILMGIAGLAGTAIEHARLFTETQAARERYAGLFDDSIDPILISDLDGRITDANYHAQTFLGCKSKTLIGSQVMDLHVPDDGSAIPQLCDLRPGLALSYEASATHSDGTQLPVEVHVKRIDVERQPVLQWMMRDLSERKALDQLRTDLTSMLFHDLRSPLGNIISSLEVMKTSVQEDDEDLDAIISVAQRSSRRLSRLIDSLLDINLLESGTAVLRKSPSSIAQLLEEAIEEVQPTADAKDQHLKVDGDGRGLPNLDIDEDMIRRVMINLIENAVKYTPSDGSIIISVQALDGEICFVVRDTGPGIDSKDQKRIFEKFARVERKGRSKGLGLGLAFCRLAVEAHGGRIWVESGQEQGSVFSFTLPV
jgi:NtrC-family two-component system sensor histidine kinase KinB